MNEAPLQQIPINLFTQHYFIRNQSAVNSLRDIINKYIFSSKNVTPMGPPIGKPSV